jgi:hypothetical protein
MNKQEKIGKVMKEFKEGTLKTSAGKKVKSRKQAVAIAMSESEGYTEKADLISQINIDSLQEAEDILKAAGSEDLFEKAKHQDGDMHPNGKWVWVSSVNGGKGDWRTKGGRTKNSAAGGNAGTPNTQQKPPTTGMKGKKEIKDKTNQTKHSAFVIKTIDKIKDVLKYKDISDEHIQKLADAITADESTAKKIIGVKFPTVGTVRFITSHSDNSSTTPISGGDELICNVEKKYVNTTRGSSPYTITSYSIYHKDNYSGHKKMLSFSSSSTGRFKKTAAEAKQECIMEALLTYYGVK